MAKRRTVLRITLPRYRGPRNAWRRKINSRISKVMGNDFKYKIDDKLEVEVLLYLTPRAAKFHDVDNRLKDIMDALQGRAGGPKARRQRLSRFCANDSCIYRVTVEKMVRPKQAHKTGGRLLVRRYRSRDLRTQRG